MDAGSSDAHGRSRASWIKKMTAAEKIKEIESKIAELNIRMSSAGGGGGGAHNFLSATHPDTDPDSPVRGDIVRGIAGPEWQRYAIGAAGRFLRSDGVDPSWDTIQVGDLPAHAAEHEIGGGDLVDHDNLTNFVANEHIDHTAVTLTAGEGLQGGGTIAANRTFDLDINGLVEDAGATSGDFFVYYDTVDGVHYKIDSDDLPGGGASPWTVDVNDIYWDGTGHCTIGAIAPDSKMTVAGFNIYTPASSDTLHFAIQNADVGHGFTAYADADTYLAIQKNNAAAGGAWIAGFSDATTQGMRLWGLSNQAPSGFATNSVACLDFAAGERSGTGGVKMADTDNAFAWINWTTTIMLLKGRGDLCFPDSQCRILLGDSVNTKMNSGITINQKGYSDEALALKSSYIGQPYTTPHESDTYSAFQKYHAYEGGLSIHGMNEVTVGVEIKGGGDTDNTTKSAAGIAPIILNATKSAAGTWGAVGADGNLVAIRNNDSSVWIIDEDGDSWQSGDITAGHIALGGRAIDPDIGISYGVEVLTDTDNSSKVGISAGLIVAKTAAIMTGSAYGIATSVSLDSTNTQNWTTAKCIRGIQGYVLTEAGSAGTIASIVSLNLASNFSATGAQVTTAYGLYVETPTVGGTKLTNAYAVYIDDINTAATLNFAIYTNAGSVRFGDDVHIPNMKSGANQAAAGAVAGELWHDTDDDTVKMGV